MNDVQIIALVFVLLLAAMIGLLISIVIMYQIFSLRIKEIQQDLTLLKIHFQKDIDDLQNN